MKKLLIGLTLLASMSSFAMTVGDVENKLADNVCGENFPKSSQEYSMAIQQALAAKSDVYRIEIKALLASGSATEAAVESGKNISRHIDLMLGASMRNVSNLSSGKVSALESLCDSL